MDKSNQIDLRSLAPSPPVKQFGEEIVRAAGALPVLDVACGGGRNSILLSHLGAQVVGIDVDLSKIERERNKTDNTTQADIFGRISLKEIDLVRDMWPYPANSVGGIVNIHFLYPPLLTDFQRSLIPGGFLVLETVEGRGGNYLQLPKAGFLRTTLEEWLSFLIYEERHAGPTKYDAVAVRVVGRKL